MWSCKREKERERERERGEREREREREREGGKGREGGREGGRVLHKDYINNSFPPLSFLWYSFMKIYFCCK